MAQVISTILFTGQFWVAIVEKHEDDGSILVGKHTFGPEPSNPEIKDFYLNRCHLLNFRSCDIEIRKKKKYSSKEQNRNLKKSFNAYKEAQKEYLQNKKSEKSKRNSARKKRSK